ncbi:MAG TPA: hypothetical protein VFW40_04480, partial [Capsulimonadaceae bacterium]|nr:hypothetical protein [Capsulimonadaceae bacterium]
GEIIGYAGQRMDGSRHEAFLYHAGQMIDLGAGTPAGINNAGEVVGMSGDTTPVLWWHGKALPLNLALRTAGGWVMTEVDAINDKSQIAGFAKHGGHLHAVILTPVEPPH